MELVKRGKSIGLSPHQVAKEIVVSHLLNHSSDINIPHKYPNYTSDINIGNKYPIYRSDTYVEHKYPTYISDINIANKAGQDPDNDKLLEKLEAFDKRLRRLEDLINAYTGKSDQVLQRLSQLVESQEKVAELLQQVAEFLRQGSAKVSEERQRVSGESERKAKREKVDACERLKRELAIFESDIADRIRDRDRFFAKIENVCGGIVVEGARERIAIEKSHWQQFLEKLSKISTNDEEKIKAVLDPLEFRLFTVLKESALIIYNASERRWKLTFKPSTDTSASNTSTDAESGTRSPGTGTSNSTAPSTVASNSSTSNSTEKRYRKRRGEEEDESWLLQYVEINDVEAAKQL
jgi:seryl-tRNA synthetase